MYDFFFAGENPTLLDLEEQKLCEGKLTKKECLNSLKDIAPDKSPGLLFVVLFIMLNMDEILKSDHSHQRKINKK